MGDSFAIRLDRPAQHFDADPGTEIVLRGVVRSTFDGSEIDAATTTWPDGAPGGASVDAGGLVDLRGGGLHLVSRDPKTHEVVAVVTDRPGAACEAAHVASPCVALRSLEQARSRLLTTSEWGRSLDGKLTAEIQTPVPPPAYAPVTHALTSPLVATGALATILFAVAIFAVARRRRSASYQMRRAIRRIEKKLAVADAALSGALAPAVKRALQAIERKRIDPASKEGMRIADVLHRVETRLDESTAHARATKEQEAADTLVLEMESALEAAHEVMGVAAG